MKLYFIFDLDYTLYDLDYKKEFDYKDLKTDGFLKFLLLSHPLNKFDKIIFTNAMKVHADHCLKLLNIPKSIFSDIVARDTINDLKPNVSAFKKFKLITQISDFDKCIFFEDTLENLKTAKLLGWKTIYIGPKLNESYNYVDLQFINIHEALQFFFNKFNHLP